MIYFQSSLFENKLQNYMNFKKIIKMSLFCHLKYLEIVINVEASINLEEFVKKYICQNSLTYTNGKTTKELLKKLVLIPLNITAISLDKLSVLPVLKNTNSILSILQVNLTTALMLWEMSIMNNFIKKNSKCKSLWASYGIPFDIVSAIKSETDIITMGVPMIEKIANFKLSREKYSQLTIKQFFLDAKKSNYRL